MAGSAEKIPIQHPTKVGGEAGAELGKNTFSKGCLQNKKNVFKDIVPIRSDTPLHSYFGTSTTGTFELAFGPPPTYKIWDILTKTWVE